MKISICWSGKLSGGIAELLKEELPNIIPSLETFVSMDQASGARWNDELAKELEASNFGILCLTPRNLENPWLHFEAGALSKNRGGRVCGLLFGGLSPDDVKGPLSQFQHRVFTKAEFLKLMNDINRVSDSPLPDKRLETFFNGRWGSIERGVMDEEGRHGERRTIRSVTAQILTVPKLPIDDDHLESLAKVVEEIRRKCLIHVRARLGSEKPDSPVHPADEEIRANVFLADYHHPPPGCAFHLMMHPRLRMQMDREAEWDIRFRPGEGATGTVFDEGGQRTLHRREFQISDALREVVHPDLKWFISTPLKAGSRVIAVFNVDGIGLDLGNDVLKPLGELILGESKTLARLLDECPKTTLKIQYEEEA